MKCYQLKNLLDYHRYLAFQENSRTKRKESLLVCQHNASITAGLQSTKESFLSSPIELKKQKISVYTIKRGGDLTAHEPGQWLIYPHLDLKKRKISIKKFLDFLIKNTSTQILKTWNIDTKVKKDAPGLYETERLDKLVSIGINGKRFFSTYGLALNVSNSLETFSHIHPCGYQNLKMTSIQKLKGDPKKISHFIQNWFQAYKDWLEKTTKIN